MGQFIFERYKPMTMSDPKPPPEDEDEDGTEGEGEGEGGDPPPPTQEAQGKIGKRRDMKPERRGGGYKTR